MTAQALANLLHARRTGQGKWQARCPAHKDRNPSLSISEGKDGRVLLNCHAGCLTAEVLAAKGLNMADLYPSKQPAPAKPDGNAQTVHYPYLDASGNLLYRVTRFPDKQFRQSRPDGKGGWIWNLDGITRVPYRLPELLRADVVMITEGEKDADTLAGLHLEKYPAFEGRKVAATTNSGGAGKWNPADGEYLKGKDALVFEDNDEPGRKHTQDILASVYPHAKRAKLIRLPGLSEHSDVSDWMQERSASELTEQMQNAPLWHPGHDATMAAAKAESGSRPLPKNDVQAIAHDVLTRDLNAGKVDILTAALETIEANVSYREWFHALCVALQRLRGNEPVVLPVERIAAGFGCHFSLIAKLRRQAVVEGWLKPERPAIAHRRAGSFYVLSETPAPVSHYKEYVMEEIPQLRTHSHFSKTPESEPLVRHHSETPPGEVAKTLGEYEVIEI